MKSVTTPFRVALLGLIIGAQAVWAQQQPAGLYCNPITLNGHPLNIESFTMYTRGVLAVVHGDPASANHKPLPFRVYLRRAGTIIRQGASNDTHDVYSVQLQELMPVARAGDELVIDLAGDAKAQAGGRRTQQVIRLKPFDPLISWFRRNDNC